MKAIVKLALLGAIAVAVAVAVRSLRAATEGGTASASPHGAAGAARLAEPLSATHGPSVEAKPAGRRTRAELYEEAKRRGIRGRSKMTKAQLEATLTKGDSQ